MTSVILRKVRRRRMKMVLRSEAKEDEDIEEGDEDIEESEEDDEDIM